MALGRPRLYDSWEAFDAKADEYFAHVEATGKRPTLAGLCLFMGFCDKESFTNYATYGDDFSRTVNKARLRMEEDRWQSLNDKGAFTPGLIFDLKNNHGWKDKTEVEQTVSVREWLSTAT